VRSGPVPAVLVRRHGEAFCRERGREPERPYSGTFLVRAGPELHRAVALRAAAAGKSINARVTGTLDRAAGA
jgi:predicted HicB family RNase H-like nuclease